MRAAMPVITLVSLSRSGSTSNSPVDGVTTTMDRPVRIRSRLMYDCEGAASAD